MSKRISYYSQTIEKWINDKDASILVVAGGTTDRDVFLELGFNNVTISNIDERVNGTEFEPFEWSFQNSENLSFSDNAFDYVVVHAGLHHCFSPHRALLNMYRVAKRGVILFESRDSFVMRLLVKLDLTQTYEHAAVFQNDCRYGGVQNSDIPNFVYRWTEREIEKTISSYAPFARHHFKYAYGYDIPHSSKRRKKATYKTFFVQFSRFFYSMFVKLFPRQQNLFACYIEKPSLQSEHFEWLKNVNGKLVFNQDWAQSYYKEGRK